MSLIEDVPERLLEHVDRIAKDRSDEILKVVTRREDGELVGVIYVWDLRKLQAAEAIRNRSKAKGETHSWRLERYRQGVLMVGRAEEPPG